MFERGSAERRADQTIGRARHLHAQINATRIGEAGAFTVAVSLVTHRRSSHLYSIKLRAVRTNTETKLVQNKESWGARVESERKTYLERVQVSIVSTPGVTSQLCRERFKYCGSD